MNGDALTDKVKRKSNIELLRMLCMFMIVLSHFCVHSGFCFDEPILSFNRVYTQLFSIGEIGVDCFVIISGYFLVNSNFKSKKVIKLIGEMWFYSISILLIVYVFGLKSVDVGFAVKSLLPIYNLHWFAYAYFVLYLLSPFINRLILALEQKEMEKMLALQVVIWSIMPIFLNADMEYSILVWFIFLYMIGAYIRLYKDEKIKCNLLKKYLLGFIMMLVLCVISIDAISMVIKIPKASSLVIRLYATNSPFILLISITLFLLFKNINISYNKFVNKLSATMFGVYLIHDNPAMRDLIWRGVFNNAVYSSSDILWIISIFETITIMIVCVIIDFIRIKYIENKFINILDVLVFKIGSYIHLKK